MVLLCCRGDTSEDEDPFREWCGKVGELRALVSSPLVALTATATKVTRDALKSKLGLRRCRTIVQSPDRPNIKLSVRKVSPSTSVSHLASVLDELKTKRNQCSRLLVYCQKISDCSDFYVEFMGELGDLAYWPDDAPHISDNRLVSMYHSGTPEYNKAVVLQSLQDQTGVCRVVFATSALGMGIDVKGLHILLSTGVHHQNWNTTCKKSEGVEEMAYLAQQYCCTMVVSFVTVTNICCSMSRQPVAVVDR